jgi:drug/metabolite transporter (DMT)-like permease
MMPEPSAKPYLWMLCGSAWFAAMVLFIDASKGQCAWQTVATVRAGIATIFAFSLALATRVPLVFPGPPTLWLRSIAGSCSMVATFYALTHLPGSDVLVITNSFPIWLALLSWPLFGERPTLTVILAILCAVVGVAVIYKADFQAFTLAHASAVFASIFTAVAMMGLNRLKGLQSLAIVTHFSAVSTVFCLACFFVFPLQSEVPITPDSTMLWLKLLAVGGTATVGQVFLTKAFRGGVATKISVVGLSQVVMVMFWEGIVGGRVFTTWQLVGAALVLGPTAYLMARERRKPEPVNEAPVVAIE